jgi:hypothetical protein
MAKKAKKTAKAKTKEHQRPKRESVVVSMLLDESGSMGLLRDATISGFNEYVGGLRKSLSEHDVHFSALKFDSPGGVVKLQVGVPIKAAIELTHHNYCPRGGTPLLDAVGRTIQATDEVAGKNKATKIIVVIQTDGAENSSQDFKLDQIKQMVEERQGKGWEFVFIGAGINAFEAGLTMGVYAGSTMSYGATGQATMDVFGETALNTANFATGATQNMNYTAAQSLASGEDINITRAKMAAQKPRAKA